MKARSIATLLSLSTAITLAMTTASYALPTGGSVSSGAASISSSGNMTIVSQSTSKAVINWTGFNTTSGQTVMFNDQQGSSSVTLNRVSGGATTFGGSLFSNGNVWIINPQGILISSTGKVNSAGFLATTSAITDSNFMAGTYNFTPGGGAAGAAVSNAGNITIAEDGLAALVAPNVANSGSINFTGNIINAKVGTIALASGDAFTMDLAGDGLINLSASSAVTQQSITNTGTLNAIGYSGGGSVQITAAQASNLVNNLINLDGVIEANSLTASNQGGDLEYGSKFEGSTGGSFALSAFRDIIVDPGVQIAPASGKLNVTLDANDTAPATEGAVYQGTSSGGYIYMQSGSAISSNGGNITLGGGTNPLTGFAQGNDVDWKGELDEFSNDVSGNGIYLSKATLKAGDGTITLNGAAPYNYYNSTGINLYDSTLSATGNGTVNMTGIGIVPYTTVNHATGLNTIAVALVGDSGTEETAISTDDGVINITGHATGTQVIANDATGVDLDYAKVASTGTGAVALTGDGLAAYSNVAVNVANSTIGAPVGGISLAQGPLGGSIDVQGSTLAVTSGPLNINDDSAGLGSGFSGIGGIFQFNSITIGNSNLSSTSGNIIVSGTSFGLDTGGTNADGLDIAGSTIKSGSGYISLTGFSELPTGYVAVTGHAYGLDMTASTITDATGEIALQGEGGTASGTNAQDQGVSLVSDTVTAAGATTNFAPDGGSASIIINATGGRGNNTNGQAAVLESTTLSAQSSAGIIILGFDSEASGAYSMSGVELAGGVNITTPSLTIFGEGAGSGASIATDESRASELNTINLSGGSSVYFSGSNNALNLSDISFIKSDSAGAAQLTLDSAGAINLASSATFTDLGGGALNVTKDPNDGQ